MTRREPHIWTRYQDKRPFEDYADQPDTAERVRLAVQAIQLWLPEKMLRAGLDTGCRPSLRVNSRRDHQATSCSERPVDSNQNARLRRVSFHAAAAPNDTKSEGEKP